MTSAIRGRTSTPATPGAARQRLEEIADVMLFLASSRASYITGTIITIDGGVAARGSII